MIPTDNLEAGAGDLVAVAWRYRGPRGGWITVDEKPTGWHSEPLYSAAQLAAVTAENARLREALTIADQAVCDWLNLYASDMCEPGRVAEAQERVGSQGTIAYIADVLQSIRAALSQEAPK